LGLLLFFASIYGLWFGSRNSAQNLAPLLIYITLWIGVPLLSLFLGDIWAAVNPYDTMAAIGQRARRGRWSRRPEPLDDERIATSYWPAAAGLFLFIWLELCYHHRWDVRVLALWATMYSLLILGGAAYFGRAWLQRSETFTAYFGLIARLAPLHYDREGRRLRLRWPLTGLAEIETAPGITVLLLVSIGGTTFDASTRSVFWQKVIASTTGWGYSFAQTFGLLWITGAVAIAYALATAASAWITGDDRYDAPSRFLPALVPIAYGYTFAHYLSYLIYDGQDSIRLLSNPFGKNWNIFGTADYVINSTFVPAGLVSWTRFAVIIAAHVAAAWFVWDHALESGKPHEIMRGQLPVLAIVVGYCGTALLLLLA
jgi:hypothetical protein